MFIALRFRNFFALILISSKKIQPHGNTTFHFIASHLVWCKCRDLHVYMSVYVLQHRKIFTKLISSVWFMRSSEIFVPFTWNICREMIRSFNSCLHCVQESHFYCMDGEESTFFVRRVCLQYIFLWEINMRSFSNSTVEKRCSRLYLNDTFAMSMIIFIIAVYIILANFHQTHFSQNFNQIRLFAALFQFA